MERFGVSARPVLVLKHLVCCINMDYKMETFWKHRYWRCCWSFYILCDDKEKLSFSLAHAELHCNPTVLILLTHRQCVRPPLCTLTFAFFAWLGQTKEEKERCFFQPNILRWMCAEGLTLMKNNTFPLKLHPLNMPHNITAHIHWHVWAF